MQSNCRDMEDEQVPEKRELTRVDPNMKVSEREWQMIRDLVCAGASATELAEKYNIEPNTIHRKASVEKWPTPRRIQKAQSKGLPVGDPASMIAKMWSKRQGESREEVYQGASKSLRRFWAKSPVPQNFAEAAIAEKMLNKAIDPTEGKSDNSDPNLQLLAAGGDIIDVEQVEPECLDENTENISQNVIEELESIPDPSNTPTINNSDTTDQ